ncbi:MAG: YbjN domain-containing protein [Beutenbergiaceae bacterium]
MAEPDSTPPGDFDDEELHPVDQARLTSWLQRNAQQYFITRDGIIGGHWNASMFTFPISNDGQMFQVRGTWNRAVAIERREELIAFFNERHMRHPWPKCYLMVLDDGSVRVATAVTTAIGLGLSQHQLDRAIRIALANSLAVFAELSKRYPDPVASPPEPTA